MLSSWFGQQKGQDEDTLDGNGPRPSSSTPLDAQARASTEKAKRAFPSAFSTPHDAVLAALQAPAPKPVATDTSNRPGSTRDDQVNSPDIPEPVGDIQSRMEALNLRSNTPTSNMAGAARSTPTELLLDPFDGSVLGVLVPKQDDGTNPGSKSRSQVNLPGTLDSLSGAPGPPRAGNDAVWSHLTRILDIQSQISKQHLEMEGIGTVKAGDAKRKAHKRATRGLGGDGFGVTPLATPEVGVEEPLVLPSLRSRGRALSNVSTISSASEGEGDEEGVNVPSEEAEEKRLREEEFEKLANQFEGRKEAINDIMSKVCYLASYLYLFQPFNVIYSWVNFQRRCQSFMTCHLQTLSFLHLGIPQHLRDHRRHRIL
jgi:hypothetical protein